MYYKLNFDIVTWHNFSLTELEDMIVFERDVYINYIEEKMKKEEEAKS